MIGRNSSSPGVELVATIVAWGPIGVLILLLADSVIPLPGLVDGMVVLASTAGWDRAALTAPTAIAGSVAGNLILFLMARTGGEAYLARHCVSRRAQRFVYWFRLYGLLTALHPGTDSTWRCR